MKVKFYSQLFLAAMTAVFVATGCSKDDKNLDPDPGQVTPTTPNLVLSIAPGDMLGLDKDIRLTISGQSSGVTSGRLLLVANDELEAALATGVTIESIINNDRNSYPFEPEELVSLNSEQGWKYAFSKLTPATAYTTIVKVTNAVGSTIKSISASTLATAGENGPGLDLTLTRGNKDGAKKTTDMTVAIKSTGAMAGRYGLFQKAQVDAALEKGYSLSYIIENNGAAFTPEHITQINNSEGFGIAIEELSPNVAYTFIVKLASTGGTTIKTASATTASGVGPAATVSMVPGDKQGTNKDTNLSVLMKSSGALSARQALLLKADFDAEIDKGTTPGAILDAQGQVVSATDMAALNSTAGLNLVFSALLPNTAYMHMLEVEDDNGAAIEYTSALTAASGGATSEMTFSFEVEDLATTTASFSVIPSNNTETYYFDYLEVAEYDKLTDAEWISRTIGNSGITSDKISTGIAGYDAEWFDMLALTPGTEYYIYAFGYDAEKKSATTDMTKYKFTTQTGAETPTDAYNAWIGTWTVVSTSSEKTSTPVTFEVSIAQKVVNVSYKITGWGITSYRNRAVTAALKSDGGFRISNKQKISTLSSGILYFAGRYYNPVTLKYAVVPARVDALTGMLDAGNQSATVLGGTFSVEGDASVQTVPTMDYFNNKFDGTWVGYVALAPYKESGYPVGPYTMTKTSTLALKAPAAAANTASSLRGNYKAAMEKHALAKQISASIAPKRLAAERTQSPELVTIRPVAMLKLADGSTQVQRSQILSIDLGQ